MITLIEIPCGKSIAIGFVFPIDYDLDRIEDLKVYLEDEIFESVLTDNVVRCEVPSEKTAVLEGIQRLSFKLVNIQTGTYSFYAGDIRVDSSNEPIIGDPINKGFDLLINLTVSDIKIAIESVFYNYYKGDAGAIIPFNWVKFADDTTGIGLSVIPGARTPVLTTREISVSASCLLDENGHNTGQQEVHTKKQKLVGENWVDVGEEIVKTITNHDACPPYVIPVDPYHAHMSVHESAYDFANEVPIQLNFGNEVTLSTPKKATDEYGYFFISVPANKTFKVFNMFHTDVTAGFMVIAPIADNRAGFQNNLIYRDFDAYDISESVTLFIIIG